MKEPSVCTLKQRTAHTEIGNPLPLAVLWATETTVPSIWELGEPVFRTGFCPLSPILYLYDEKDTIVPLELSTVTGRHSDITWRGVIGKCHACQSSVPVRCRVLWQHIHGCPHKISVNNTCLQQKDKSPLTYFWPWAIIALFVSTLTLVVWAPFDSGSKHMFCSFDFDLHGRWFLDLDFQVFPEPLFQTDYLVRTFE